MSITPAELQGLKDTESLLVEKLNYLRKEAAILSPGTRKFNILKNIEDIEKELDAFRLQILNATPSLASKKILDNLIYIAYHQSNSTIADSISLELQKKGYSPWMRKSTLTSQREQLEWKSRIQNAKLILVFLSENGLDNPLREDIEMAIELSKQEYGEEIFIIPIKLGNCIVPDILTQFDVVDLPLNSSLRQESLNRVVIQPILDAVATKFSLIDETGELTISHKFKQLSRTANRRYLDYSKEKTIEGISANTIYLAGIYSYSIKQFDEAHRRFKMAKKFGYPEDRGIQSRIAGCLIKEGIKQKNEAKYMLALEILDKILAKFPDYVLALYNKAIALKKLNRDKESKAVIHQLLKYRPDSEMARNNLTLILQEENDLEGAINTLSYLVERGKDTGLTNYNLACYYTLTGKLELAFERLLESFEYHLENVVAAINDKDLSALKQTNDYGVSFWNITRDMLAFYVKRAINTANVLIMNDKLDEALEKLIEITNFRQENGLVNYTIARVYAQRKEYDEVIEYLKLAKNESESFIDMALHDPIFNQFKTINNGKLFWEFIKER